MSETDGGLRRIGLRFVGEVQGVGFRWTSRRVAEGTGVTGWVRNESDGSVQMEIQGTDEQIAAFFGDFSVAYRRYPISYTIDARQELAVNPRERSFSVRFY